MKAALSEVDHPVEQFGSSDKLGSGCRQAANFFSPSRRLVCGRRAKVASVALPLSWPDASPFQRKGGRHDPDGTLRTARAFWTETK